MSPKALFPPPPEPTVVWDAHGTPRSPRFGDIYRNQGLDGRGGLEQSRHVFMHGCGLLGPRSAWRGQPHWTILETGFGLGLNFLTAWQAWRADPDRPRHLHFASVEAYPVTADDLIRSAAPWPELQPLATELAERWWGLVPGIHRLQLADGQVHLTLGIGPAAERLPDLSLQADSVFLDGFAPDLNPDMWKAPVLAQVAALCQAGTRLATWSVTRSVRDTLSALGFQVERVPGLAPKRHALTALYSPIASPNTEGQPDSGAQALLPTRSTSTGSVNRLTLRAEPAPPRCAVVGAGLAGAAIARALAERGWHIEVFEAGPSACSGASGLPAGLCAPHVSQDDSWLSRLTRAGVRATREQATRLLHAGLDYDATGVLERRLPRKTRKARLPHEWSGLAEDWSRLATPEECARTFVQTPIASDEPLPLWHPSGLWLKPSRLVLAQLNHTGIQLHVQTPVLSIQRDASNGDWHLRHDRGTAGPFDHVVLCAGPSTRELLSQVLPHERLPLLTPVRGQLSWGQVDAPLLEVLPSSPVNGDGSFLGPVPDEQGALWMTGSTFDRLRHTPEVDPGDHHENLTRLHGLLPDVAYRLDEHLATGRVHAWAAVRCTTPDRLPRVGCPDLDLVPGLHMLTGLGARGLTLSVLCGQWLAAQLCHEPLPLEPDLSRRLAADRA